MQKILLSVRFSRIDKFCVTLVIIQIQITRKLLSSSTKSPYTSPLASPPIRSISEISSGTFLFPSSETQIFIRSVGKVEVRIAEIVIVDLFRLVLAAGTWLLLSGRRGDTLLFGFTRLFRRIFLGRFEYGHPLLVRLIFIV